MIDLFSKGVVGLLDTVVGKAAGQIERLTGLTKARTRQAGTDCQSIFVEGPRWLQAITGIGISPGAMLVSHLRSLTAVHLCSVVASRTPKGH